MEDYSLIRAAKKQQPLQGIKRDWVLMLHKLRNLIYVISLYKSPRKIVKLLTSIKTLRKSLTGNNKIKKIVEVEGKYYWRLNVPGWGTSIFKNFLSSELNRIEPHKGQTTRLINSYIAITKKCPLRCEHCFEWNNLNKPEVLSLENIHQIVSNLHKIGTGIISFTGGEPMLRTEDMVDVIKRFKGNSAFWVLTSGFNFTEENAIMLKQAGLTGVVVSLDHYSSEKHDQFRGHPEAYKNALTAIKLGIENDLVSAISLCITRENATDDFLNKYIELAKDLGVAFVQLLEPKPIGHYAGKEVTLSSEQIELLEKFYCKMNDQPAYENYPIIIYHGYYQRRMGCLASGNRSIYIDTNGDIQACPFCQSKVASMLDTNFAEKIDELAGKGCGVYE